MEFYDFPIILGIMIPIDELIFLRGVETTNQFTFPIHTKI
jgi:hypothetical protein